MTEINWHDRAKKADIRVRNFISLDLELRA